MNPKSKNAENAVAKDRNRSGIQVIARAASIMRILEDEGDGLSLAEIAKRSHLAKSTVQRIVGALVREGLLDTSGGSSQITLGPAIQRMAAHTKFNYAQVVRPYLESLADNTGETVDLSVMAGDKMIFVDQINSTQRLSAVSAIGSSFPVFSSANGKAALALLKDKQIEKIFREHALYRETSHTITEMPKLLSEIETIRESAVAVDNEEHTEGISALGTAFRDPGGRIFAVSVPIPTVRFQRSKHAVIEALLKFRDEFVED